VDENDSFAGMACFGDRNGRSYGSTVQQQPRLKRFNLKMGALLPLSLRATLPFFGVGF
jgi:hypothetical protein